MKEISRYKNVPMCVLYFSSLARPDPPPTPELKQVTATTITVQWTAGTEDPIKSFFLMYKQSSDMGAFLEIADVTETTYTILDLMPFTQYDVKVSAVNTIGRGNPSNALMVTTAELGKAIFNSNVDSNAHKLKKYEILFYTNVLLVQNHPVGVSMYLIMVKILKMTSTVVA